MNNRKHKSTSGVVVARVLRLEMLESRLPFASDFGVVSFDLLADQLFLTIDSSNEMFTGAQFASFSDVDPVVVQEIQPPGKAGVLEPLSIMREVDFGFALDNPAYALTSSIPSSPMVDYLFATSALELTAVEKVDTYRQPLLEEAIDVADLHSEPILFTDLFATGSFSSHSLLDTVLPTSEIQVSTLVPSLLAIEGTTSFEPSIVGLQDDFEQATAIVGITSTNFSLSFDEHSLDDLDGLAARTSHQAGSPIAADNTVATLPDQNFAIALSELQEPHLGSFGSIGADIELSTNYASDERYYTLSGLIHQSDIEIDLGSLLTLEENDGLRAAWHRSQTSPQRPELDSASVRIDHEDLAVMLAIGGEVGLDAPVNGHYCSVVDDFVVQTTLICDDLYVAPAFVQMDAHPSADVKSNEVSSRYPPLAAIGGVILVLHAGLLLMKPSEVNLMLRLLPNSTKLAKHLSKKPL